MNEGQKMFSEFILERVEDNKRSEAEKMLREAFERQEKGTFDHAYLQSFISGVLKMIRPDAKKEVENVMVNYKIKS